MQTLEELAIELADAYKSAKAEEIRQNSTDISEELKELEREYEEYIRKIAEAIAAGRLT